MALLNKLPRSGEANAVGGAGEQDFFLHICGANVALVDAQVLDGVHAKSGVSNGEGRDKQKSEHDAPRSGAGLTPAAS